MQRREATLVFREICECTPDAFLLNSVSLNSSSNAANPEEESFELLIKALLDKSTLKRIRSIVKRHKLTMDENRDSVLIYAPELRPMEIIA